MIAIPQAVDQFGNAAMLVEAGVGVTIDREDVTADALRAAAAALDTAATRARSAELAERAPRGGRGGRGRRTSSRPRPDPDDEAGGVPDDVPAPPVTLVTR